MDQKLIERINFLARKAKSEGLSPEEKSEQEKLRQEYLKEFRAGFKQRLDNTVFLKELTINKDEITQTNLEKLKTMDGIEQIKLEADKYIILYDIKKVNEEQILELIAN